MCGIIGCVFFILVIFAALTSSISLVETCTSIIADGSRMSRKKALAIVVVFTTAVGAVVMIVSGLLLARLYKKAQAKEASAENRTQA